VCFPPGGTSFLTRRLFPGVPANFLAACRNFLGGIKAAGSGLKKRVEEE